ncbi:MAG: ubiquinone/menaquinone biosynthesis methyltransferase [Chloroflexi bacterium]|nr:ubiquinone/menaquinone biosynthesis methyltransferase [Chloroflexota bacterium]
MAELRGEAKATYVSALFARIARRYDLFNTVVTFGDDRRWRSLVADLALARGGQIGVDVATGTGEIAMELSRRGVRVVGVDFCREMMGMAVSKASRDGHGERTGFVLGDAVSLPLGDSSFDFATTGFALRNVVSIPALFMEIARVVRPGGRVVCIELTRPPAKWFCDLYEVYLQRVVPLVGRLVWDRLEPEAYSYLPNSIALCPLAEEVKGIMERCGLQGVSYKYLNLATVAVHVGTKQQSAISGQRSAPPPNLLKADG